MAFRRGSILELNAEEDGRFDYVNAMCMLHHLADPVHGLAVLAGLLTPCVLPVLFSSRGVCVFFFWGGGWRVVVADLFERALLCSLRCWQDRRHWVDDVRRPPSRGEYDVQAALETIIPSPDGVCERGVCDA